MAKTNGLTDKQEDFCRAYVGDAKRNKSKAYRMAYDAENMSNEAIWVEACRMSKDPNVALRILELEEELREELIVTVESIAQELDENRELAIEVQQPSAATQASMGKAKLYGLISDKKEVSGALDLTMRTEAEIDARIELLAPGLLEQLEEQGN